jgi:hypothetical protein
MKKFEFQVNMGFGLNVMSACGYDGTETIAVSARTLRLLLRKIIKKTGLKIEQIVLSFQPDSQP